ncbi:MAG: ABC transporter ATP-binding protein [Actinobacteria bacterium]|nr:ABC transporter ATP-binding protein [Actinomycetota bacterium]
MRLILDGLGHRFGEGAWLFTRLAVELQCGESCAVTGPSGSGKSTLLSILAGWQAPTTGQVRREDVTGVSWVAQNPFGVPGRTTLDHVVLPLLARGLTRKDAEPRARDTLGRFRLLPVADLPFGHLSGGEAQRLMLARAVLTTATLLLVDEPTAQLDPHSAATVIETLSQLADTGRIVVISTHDPRVAATCARSITLGVPA